MSDKSKLLSEAIEHLDWVTVISGTLLIQAPHDHPLRDILPLLESARELLSADVAP
jgi:hypothetical protein